MRMSSQLSSWATIEIIIRMLPVDEGPTNEACDPVEEPSLRPLYGHELKHFKLKVTKSYHNLLLWFSGCAENCGHHSPVLRLCRPSINHESSTDKSFPDLDNEKLWLPLQLWAVFIVEPPEHVQDQDSKKQQIQLTWVCLAPNPALCSRRK